VKTEHERKLDKIKKCLRLAKSSNEHEAAAALRQARKMMDEIGVSADDVAASEAAEARVRSQAKQNAPEWEQLLAMVVAEAIGCGVYFSSGVDLHFIKKPGQYVFVGCDGAQAIAQYAYVVLNRQLKAARQGYLRRHLSRLKRVNRIACADSFCAGWVMSVHKKIGSLAIAPERASAIAAYLSQIDLQPEQARKASASPDRYYAHFNSGYREGGKVDLRKPMTGDAQQPEALR